MEATLQSIAAFAVGALMTAMLTGSPRDIRAAQAASGDTGSVYATT
jgi:hypothetical protein